MHYTKLPTQGRLNELFDYNPNTGIVARKIEAGGQVAGTIISKVDDQGYLRVNVDYKKYKLHRIIWMMMTGKDPGELLIDHEDRNRSNNKWNNLRLARQSKEQDAPHLLNAHNLSLKPSNTTGYENISWCNKDQTYIVRSLIDGKRVRLGSSKNLEEAIAIQKRGKVITTYHITDPNGKEYKTQNLTAFCRDYPCDRRALHKYKKSKGYKLTTTTHIIN